MRVAGDWNEHEEGNRVHSAGGGGDLGLRRGDELSQQAREPRSGPRPTGQRNKVKGDKRGGRDAKATQSADQQTREAYHLLPLWWKPSRSRMR